MRQLALLALLLFATPQTDAAETEDQKRDALHTRVCSLYPQLIDKRKGTSLEGTIPRLRETLDEIGNERCERLLAARDARRALPMDQKPGASIGMLRDEVELETHWGTPRKKNMITTNRGTREQWVYSNGQYLYFEGGHLVAIQN